MRGLYVWAGIAVGFLVLILVTFAIGWRDEGEPVSNAEWAQNVCGVVATWHGDLEAMVEDIRTPPAFGNLGAEEPQSETEQGRTGFVRAGLERAIEATNTLVDGVDRAGAPRSPQAAQLVSDWADKAQDDLQAAQDSLDEEAGSIRESVEQVAGATRSLSAVIASGVETLADVARVDPELAAAVRDSSTCQELREAESD
jgi:hypothetical protein